MLAPARRVTRSSRLTTFSFTPNVTPSPSSGLLRNSATSIVPRRTLLAPPNASTGPLMSRQPNRALPPLRSPSRKWLYSLPLFGLVMTLSTLAIFNYQKTSSSVVHSTLYALRTHPRARGLLGDEIYFAHAVPWIHGEIDTVHGCVDVGFWVKGRDGKGWMRFRSERKTRMGPFETVEWSLEMEGGEMVDLMVDEGKR